MSKEKTKSAETMTLEKFFKSKKRMAIHCKTKEQSEILLKAFDKMGKTWRGGDSYLKVNNWRVYEKETCYSNNGFFGFKDFYLEEKIKVVEFENIEFEPKKKLTSKEITKWILENCVSKNGDIMLQCLDFGDKNVYINLLKTTGNVSFSDAKVGGNLHQSNQKVGGNLLQGSQKVSGNLYQSSQEVKSDLIQSGQKVGGDLFQDLQEVNGNLFSHKLEQNEMWENRDLYVVRKKVLKPITRKELAEMGFEIKD